MERAEELERDRKSSRARARELERRERERQRARKFERIFLREFLWEETPLENDECILKCI